MSSDNNGSVPGRRAHDEGDFDSELLAPEDFAPIAAVDGMAALPPHAAAAVDITEVERFEAAAGALFAAFELERRESKVSAPPSGLEERLFGAADLYVATHPADHPSNHPGGAASGRPSGASDASDHRSRDMGARAPHQSRGGDENGRRPSAMSPQSSVDLPSSTGAQRSAPAALPRGTAGSRAGGSMLESSGADSAEHGFRERGSLAALAGWAAAAALLIGLLFSIDRASKLEEGLVTAPAAERLAQLELVAPDIQQLAWLPLGNESAPKGSVIWSDNLNEGFMRIEGLAANDPEVSQYQLWIFRGTDTKAEPHPVDGGVFDVPSSGEVIIPIDAKISVGSAGTFAVTVEKPGGVVVSNRERIVLLAQRAS